MGSSSIPNPCTSATSQDWDTYFLNQFEGPEKLKTKLIRGLVARICSSNSALRKRIEKRGNTPYFEILRDLNCDKVIEDLKHVAKDDTEVKELIVSFVLNRESILGEARKEMPALKEELVVEVEEDGRVPMVLRARTFKQIVSEIGTARSRRVERVMQRAEQRRQLASGDGDNDEGSESGPEVLVTENGKRVWVGTTKASGADDLEMGKKIRRRGRRPANWLERLQYGNIGALHAPLSRFPAGQIKGRARSLSLPKDHINQETMLQSRAKSEENIDEKQPMASSATKNALVLSILRETQ